MVDDSCSWKWDFLLPWCQRLYGRLRYVKGVLEDAPGQSFRGILVQLPSFAKEGGKSSFVQQIREALGLLAAVAHVDNAAWKKLLVQYVNLDVDAQEELFEDEVWPRFQFALVGDGPDEEGELLKGIDAFCGTGQYSVCSAEYREALATIAGMRGRKAFTGSTEIEIPVTVQLGPWLTSSSEEMLAYLRKLQETVRAVRIQWREYWDVTPLRIAFVLESIMVDLRDVSVSVDLAELVESLAHDGIRVSGLALRHELCSRITSNGSREEARQVVGRLTFGLFGGSKNLEAPSGIEWADFGLGVTAMTGPLVSDFGHANELTLSSVHFDCEAMRSWVFERICSAVAVNQTARHLSLGLELNDGEEDDDDWALCRWTWQWIIFACFSEKARLHSRLESLTLRNVVITADAVQAMAEVLESSGPEEALLGLSSSPSDAAIDICIKANSPITLSPMHLDEAVDTNRSFKVAREIAGVKLVTDDDKSDWVDALVPGFGTCQVQRKNLIYRELTLPPTGLAGVTSLAIKFGDDPDPEVLQGLLLLIGASLAHLTLEFESFDTGDLEGIVACCPKLLQLAVCTHTIEMRFCLRDSNYRDLALYSASNLSFWDVESIAEALCDSENPFTKCARHLRVRMDQRAVYHPFDDCYAALLKLLEMNRTLEYLDIVAQRSHMAHYNDFKAHHLEPLPVALPFPASCKAAILSVMGGGHEELVDSKRRKCPSLMPVLDQHVLIDIFEYAAPHVSRRIYFREYDFFETGRYYMPI
ncbi:hypothetical protein PRIC1_011172 [Phytophthora ramorum]